MTSRRTFLNLSRVGSRERVGARVYDLNKLSDYIKSWARVGGRILKSQQKEFLDETNFQEFNSQEEGETCKAGVWRIHLEARETNCRDKETLLKNTKCFERVHRITDFAN